MIICFHSFLIVKIEDFLFNHFKEVVNEINVADLDLTIWRIEHLVTKLESANKDAAESGYVKFQLKHKRVFLSLKFINSLEFKR